MSQLLDSAACCDKERAAALAANDAFRVWQEQRWADFSARVDRGEASYGSYGMSCALCGDKRERYHASLCDRCATSEVKL